MQALNHRINFRERGPHILLDKLYIIDESIRQIIITLFIINVMNNLF